MAAQMPRLPDNGFIAGFAQVSSEARHVRDAQVTPAQRAQAKAIAYGLLYGKGKAALAADLDVAPDEAWQLMTDFRNSVPGLVRAARLCAACHAAPPVPCCAHDAGNARAWQQA